jgi:hypothetical protein
LVLLAILVSLVVVTRPSVPYQWDETEVWLYSAQAERQHPGSLVRCFTGEAEFCEALPFGCMRRYYPIAFPLIVGTLARFLPAGWDISRAAALFYLGLVGWLFGALLAFQNQLRVRSAWPVTLVALLMLNPFTLVHLRAGYADLAVGLGIALLNIVYLRWLAGEGSISLRSTAGAALLTTFVFHLKDEAMVAWGIATLCFVVFYFAQRRAGKALLPYVGGVGAALASFILWKHWVHRSAPWSAVCAEHVIHGVNWTALKIVPYYAALHALEPNTWGLLWPLVFGLIWFRGAAHVRLFLLLGFGYLGAVYMLGPSLQMAYLKNGTNLNRLLLQILIGSIPLWFAVNWQMTRRQSV